MCDSARILEYVPGDDKSKALAGSVTRYWYVARKYRRGKFGSLGKLIGKALQVIQKLGMQFGCYIRLRI